VEAQLIALRCGEPPAGQARWTLRLLADKAVELEIVPAISHETVRQVLKKLTFLMKLCGEKMSVMKYDRLLSISG
jgi:Homeodomain-like domain